MEQRSHNLPQQGVGVNPPKSHTRRHLIKAAGLMGAITLLSRIIGMIRDIVNAKAFGTSWQWDAFVYAFMIPNFFRRLVAEGAMAGAFVPLYNETLQDKGQDEAFRFTNILLTVSMTLLVGVLLAVEVLLGIVLETLTLPETLGLTLDFLRFLFPYLLLISCYALGMGILNSHRHFFAPAMAPAILNLCWIFGVFYVTAHGSPDFSVQLRNLCYFILFAGVLQVGIEVPFLYRLGFRPKWIWNIFYPTLAKVGKLLLPVLLGFAVVQVNLVVDMTLALAIGEGANSSLWYGSRLMQFPLGIFAIAMGTALLPAMSRQVASGEMEAARRNLTFSLRSIFFIILPCSVGFIVLSGPIVRLLFQRGEFDAESTARTAAVLVGYAIGLFAYAGQKIVTPGFYSVQDTRTPVKIGVVALVSNIVFNLILMGPLREAGLALATSISGIIQFGLLMFYFNRKITPLRNRQIFSSFLKSCVAACAMGAVTFMSFKVLDRIFASPGSFALVCGVLGSILIGVLAYILFCFAFRVREILELFEVITKRRVSGDQNSLEADFGKSGAAGD